jgi:hypothetical protein
MKYIWLVFQRQDKFRVWTLCGYAGVCFSKKDAQGTIARYKNVSIGWNYKSVRYTRG